MAPYGSAIKAWPSGQIMATPMITRRGGMQSRSHLGGLLRFAASGQLMAAPPGSVMNSRGFIRSVHAGQQLRWPPSSVMNSRVSFISARTTRWIGMVSNAHVTSFSDFFL
jgi:hypothetical protein